MKNFTPPNSRIEIALPTSKSVLIRKLIVSYLYEDKILSISPFDAEDVKIVHRNLVKISQQLNNQSHATITIDVEDCGLAFRCFMALLSITEGEWQLTGEPRLLERPIYPLEKVLLDAGAHIVRTTNGFHIKGKHLAIPHIRIDGGISSQWATALLLIAKKINLQTLTLTSPVQSYPYLNLTAQLLIQSGVNLQYDQLTYSFKEQQGKNISCRHIKEELDWSAVIYWYAVAMLFPRFSFFFPDLSLSDLQGDKIVAQWFAHIGIETIENEEGIYIERKDVQTPKELSFDVSAHPDLSPVLSVFAVLCPCKLTLTGIEALNTKESKRLDIITETLSDFASITIEKEQHLIIESNFTPLTTSKTLHFASHNDHRLVMALSLFSFFYSVEFDNPACVKKSYPTFWEDVSLFQQHVQHK